MSKRRRAIYTVTPLLLLVLCLAAINLVPGWAGGQVAGPTGEARDETVTAVSTTPSATLSASITQLPAATSTAVPTTTPSPMPSPTLPPDALIQLLGPPEASVLSANTPLSLYWLWALPVNEGQALVVYLQANGQEVRAGALAEANMGAGYRWQISPDQLAALGEQVTWQVRLETVATGDVLLSSEPRTVRLLP